MTEHEPNPAAQPATALRDDRRAYVRVPSDLAACCRPSGRGHDVSWPATVRDVSQGGVGLLLRHRFRAGTRLEIEFRLRTGAVLRHLTVRVVHATAIPLDGHPGWFVGCAFDQPISDEDLQALQ